ncbi:MAG: FAD binding domain-containing protein [Firmicutes bacterium]|nr:FAD binding domain-containing protein [Bacillota bacterium]
MLKTFEYLQPKTLEEALSMMKSCKGSFRLIAGGTDVIVQIRSGKTPPDYLISLKALNKELGILEEKEEGLDIGALVTHRILEKSPTIQKEYAALYDGVSQVGSVQVRNVGTIGGNVCSSLPSADSAAPLLILGAKLNIVGDREESICIEEFFTGPGENILKNNQILKSIFIPKLPKNSNSAYEKLGRRKAMEIPVVGAASYIQVDKKTGICLDARIALASSAPTPIRCYKAEQTLVGQSAEKEIFVKAGKLAAQEANPRTSFRATEEYRRSVIPVLVERSLSRSLNRIKK